MRDTSLMNNSKIKMSKKNETGKTSIIPNKRANASKKLIIWSPRSPNCLATISKKPFAFKKMKAPAIAAPKTIAVIVKNKIVKRTLSPPDISSPYLRMDLLFLLSKESL